jgi:ribonuclease HIII
MGIVEDDFACGEYESSVTRIAISPIFAAAYIERTKNLSEEVQNQLEIGNSDKFKRRKCKVCFKEGVKRCSRCMNVVYCSRECQSGDWREHKKDCKLSAAR